ncbi:MAG: nitroreductase family protein [Candidatus Acetothermia bacterium]
MNFFDLIKKRSSVRSFTGRSLTEEEIEKLLRAANSAPSAGNLQSYEIVVIKEKGLKEDLAEAAHGQKFIERAPALFAFIQDAERSQNKYGERGQLYSIQDGTIAATYLQLAAVELGLGSCWVGAFDEEAVKELLDTQKKPLTIIPVGHPAKSAGGDSQRRELDDLVTTLE